MFKFEIRRSYDDGEVRIFEFRLTSLASALNNRKYRSGLDLAVEDLGGRLGPSNFDGRQRFIKSTIIMMYSTYYRYCPLVTPAA